MEWFLINVLSPLLLPIFVIIVLAVLCDAKPDPFVKIYLDVCQNIWAALWKILLQAGRACIAILLRVIKCLWHCLLRGANGGQSGEPCSCDDAPKPPPGRPKRKTPPKTPPASAIGFSALDASAVDSNRARSAKSGFAERGFADPGFAGPRFAEPGFAELGFAESDGVETRSGGWVPEDGSERCDSKSVPNYWRVWLEPPKRGPSFHRPHRKCKD